MQINIVTLRQWNGCKNNEFKKNEAKIFSYSYSLKSQSQYFKMNATLTWIVPYKHFLLLTFPLFLFIFIFFCWSDIPMSLINTNTNNWIKYNFKAIRCWNERHLKTVNIYQTFTNLNAGVYITQQTKENQIWLLSLYKHTSTVQSIVSRLFQHFKIESSQGGVKWEVT